MPFWFNFKKGKTEEKESQIVEGARAYATTDFVEPQFETITPSTIQSLYDSSNLLKKYIKTIVDECLRYDLKAVPKKGFENDKTAQQQAEKINALFTVSNKYETFNEIREKYLKDILLYGYAGVELEPTEGSEVSAIYAVPGYCIRLNVDETGANFKDLKKAYFVVHPNETDKVVAYYPIDSFIFFVLDKLSDRIYGSPPITSIYQEILTDINSSKNLKSGSNSLKAGVLCLPKAPRTLLKDIITRLMQMCKRDSRVKIVASSTDGKFLDLTNLNPKDTVDLQKWLLQKANIFNIPPFKLGLIADVGSLNAREQKDDFRALVEGFVKYEVAKWNAILVKAKLKYDKVEITCPSLATKLDYERARIAVRLVNGGIITPNEARTKYLGLPRLDDPEADKLVHSGKKTRDSDKDKEKEQKVETKKDSKVDDDALKLIQMKTEQAKLKLLEKLTKEEEEED